MRKLMGIIHGVSSYLVDAVPVAMLFSLGFDLLLNRFSNEGDLLKKIAGSYLAYALFGTGFLIAQLVSSVLRDCCADKTGGDS